jgi:Mrp family chromosome partitioning ATPase
MKEDIEPIIGDETVGSDAHFSEDITKSIPDLKGKGGGAPDLILFNRADSSLGDQYRMLFTEVDRACQAGGKRIIAVTSAAPGEGKTSTVANLAVVAARNFGRRCLLIDAHFKRPKVAHIFRLSRGLGLIDVMMNRRSLELVLTQSTVENLTLLPMGHFLGKKAEVLNIDGLKDVFAKIRGQYYNVLWNEEYDNFSEMEQCEIDLFDYIFIDAPPIPSPEMAMISDAADAILLTVRAGGAPKAVVKQAAASLDPSKLIGSVLTFAQTPWPPAGAYR